MQWITSTGRVFQSLIQNRGVRLLPTPRRRMLPSPLRRGKFPLIKTRGNAMHIRTISLSIIAALLLCAVPAVAHHSNSAYQVDQIQTLVGVVKEWKWSNPHTWLYMTVDDGKGGKVEW